MLKTKITSSLENIFLDDNIDKFNEVKRISALRGERVSLQLLYLFDYADYPLGRFTISPVFEGELAKYIKLYEVRQVPVTKPVSYTRYDDNFLRTKPGLFPDLLEAIPMGSDIYATYESLHSLWIEIDIPEDTSISGDSLLTVKLYDKKESMLLTENSVTVDVIPAALPEQKLIFTQWFYCDCLASYYGVPVWSKRHWEIIENYAKVA